jgi:hypothetical protein
MFNELYGRLRHGGAQRMQLGQASHYVDALELWGFHKNARCIYECIDGSGVTASKIWLAPLDDLRFQAVKLRYENRGA